MFWVFQVNCRESFDFLLVERFASRGVNELLTNSMAKLDPIESLDLGMDNKKVTSDLALAACGA